MQQAAEKGEHPLLFVQSHGFRKVIRKIGDLLVVVFHLRADEVHCVSEAHHNVSPRCKLSVHASLLYDQGFCKGRCGSKILFIRSALMDAFELPFAVEFLLNHRNADLVCFRLDLFIG